MGKARTRQGMAYRPGTLSNRRAAVDAYKRFATQMGFDYKRPTALQVCAYIERLVERSYTPGTIRNHISAITTYMSLHSWSTKSIRSLRVVNALKAVDRNIRHVPLQRAPVTPELLRRIVRHMKGRENGPMIVLAILLMFHAFLRQSNLLPRSVRTFDPTRQLTTSDVSVANSTMEITVKWSKTHQTLGDSRVINLHANPRSPLCPVTAYSRTQYIKGRTRPQRPLIAFQDGNPITLGYLKRQWSEVLISLHLSPATYSLHSLRRGGASYCYYQGGASINQVKRHGGWVSDSVRAYLKPPRSFKDSVHRALLDL